MKQNVFFFNFLSFIVTGSPIDILTFYTIKQSEQFYCSVQTESRPNLLSKIHYEMQGNLPALSFNANSEMQKNASQDQKNWARLWMLWEKFLLSFNTKNKTWIVGRKVAITECECFFETSTTGNISKESKTKKYWCVLLF